MAQLDYEGRSMVISLVMGLGRTKLFLALLEYHVRKLVQENEFRGVVALYPPLLGIPLPPPLSPPKFDDLDLAPFEDWVTRYAAAFPLLSGLSLVIGIAHPSVRQEAGPDGPPALPAGSKKSYVPSILINPPFTIHQALVKAVR
ncbi:hypothetical protein AAL_04759 [Moelleriella libera RCEF 2490]|uniref:Uncharacterized protein n=1 Tax=Moelleriella libera RCEF 2490 TaxID=1081109 RepID=A0A168BNF0_9HYPO|nr:hypothetical protein AAL_04759 [Moelleriella libera RCEF 2490]